MTSSKGRKKQAQKEASKKNLLKTPTHFKNLQNLMNDDEKEDAIFAKDDEEDDLSIYDRKYRKNAGTYDKIDMEMGSLIEFLMTKKDLKLSCEVRKLPVPALNDEKIIFARKDVNNLLAVEDMTVITVQGRTLKFRNVKVISGYNIFWIWDED